FQQLCFEFLLGLAFLGFANQGAKVFAGRSVTFGRHLGLDESLHLVGQRNIHGGHGSSSSSLPVHRTTCGKYCQGKTRHHHGCPGWQVKRERGRRLEGRRSEECSFG